MPTTKRPHLQLVPITGATLRRLRRPKRGYESVMLDPTRLAEFARQMHDQAERLETISNCAAEAAQAKQAIIAAALSRQASQEARWGSNDLRTAAAIIETVARLLEAGEAA